LLVAVFEDEGAGGAAAIVEHLVRQNANEGGLAGIDVPNLGLC
jgi:hypothetical protein